MIIAALLLASSSPAIPVYADLRSACGIGRIAERARELKVREARARKRELEKQGQRARLVIILPGVELDGAPGPMVTDPAC